MGDDRAQDRPTVLIVDDTAVLRELIADVLSLEGYKTVTAADGIDALRKLSQGERPCVILMDLAMPNMDGFELAARVKARSEWESIPIVVLSALLPGRTVPDAAAHLAKPVPMTELLDTISRHCGSPPQPPDHTEEPEAAGLSATSA
ncbi:MAG TPA: response regulator [Candidatus Limnocylindria bacterium]|nr:response regulator [Candidatus Limnocylindria bacterium]